MSNNGRFINIMGQRFGRLVALAHVRTTRHGGAQWRCRCDCGKETFTLGRSLRSGHTKSCGCFQRDCVSEFATQHGLTRKQGAHPLVNTWYGMVSRCHRPYATAYRHYGGRGITVCDRWRHGEHGLAGLECFIADMGEKPSKKHSLDRVDNDGNYEPGNCRWATRSEQNANRRRHIPEQTAGMLQWL